MWCKQCRPRLERSLTPKSLLHRSINWQIKFKYYEIKLQKIWDKLGKISLTVKCLDDLCLKLKKIGWGRPIRHRPGPIRHRPHQRSKLIDAGSWLYNFQQSFRWKLLNFSNFERKTTKEKILHSIFKSSRSTYHIWYLTLSSPSTTTKYHMSLDPDEMLSKSASHLDPICLTLRQHLPQVEHYCPSTVKQARNVAGDNLFGGLSINNCAG